VGKITVSVDLNVSIDKVWDIISDLDNEPKFWKGTKEIRNISSNENIVKREVTIAFRDQKCMQEITILPKQKIEAKFTKGIIIGKKILNLKETQVGCNLEVIWEIKLSGMMGMFTGMITKHIQSGTEQALQAIKQEVEN
jgi:ribosome-associated toxin RatA of RatAB toxin-antitoxin module|tara:strand:- start:2498 stop:2914 length:417 start_codon:yes stop_codon:yes gene_type:complete